MLYEIIKGFSSGSVGKESACNAEDPGLIPGSERSPGEGSCNPFQYPCLENPTDRGAWQATVHRVAKHWTKLSEHACTKLLNGIGFSLCWSYLSSLSPDNYLFPPTLWPPLCHWGVRHQGTWLMPHTHLSYKIRDINTPGSKTWPMGDESWQRNSSQILLKKTLGHLFIIIFIYKKVIKLYSCCLFRLALAATYGLTGHMSHTYNTGDIPVDEWELHKGRKLSGVSHLFVCLTYMATSALGRSDLGCDSWGRKESDTTERLNWSGIA